MRKLIIILIFLTAVHSCKKDEQKLPQPSSVSSLAAEPRIGGALLRWEFPADSNFLYGQITYRKVGSQEPEKIYKVNVSKYADTLLIEGLINKNEYTFQLQLFHQDKNNVIGGASVESNSVRPIARPSEITYFPSELTKLSVTDVMIDTYTQESSEGPKSNLVDGDIATYWHSAWSSGVAPLPHWIQLNFEEKTELGAIKYYFRQNNSDVNGRPTQWAVEISEDGAIWERVYTSPDNLTTDNPTQERSLSFDKNYQSRYFRVMITKNGGESYTHLGEISFYKMASSVIDKEAEAEEDY